jgi:flagellin FlaB
MLTRICKRLATGARGITGLETAIILIAFVVVASVFAYTVLSAGIFSSEKGKEAIHEGLESVQASMELVGGVVAKDTDGDGDVDRIEFTVANALGGQAIDLKATTDADADGILSDETNRVHTTVLSYLDSSQRVDDIAWTKTQLGKGDGDDLLEEGEKFIIVVPALGSAVATDPVAYTQFTIEFKPDNGAALIFQRTLPPKIDSVMDLK